jgi:flagellar hook-associated protein 2
MSVSRSGITFGGLSSGIDVNSIVTQLMTLEKIPITRLQTQGAKLQNSAGVYSSLKGQLSSFSSALSSLKQTASFNTLSATSSSSAVATVSSSSGASPGTYNLVVKKLAQAHKISSSAQADTTSALGQTGSFKVEGKEVAVDASDSLTSIAQKINTLGSKVTASVLNGGTGKAYLTITANSTGADAAVDIEDVSGGILASLGNMSTEVVAAQDAEFDLDQLTGLKSSTNSVTSLIPGATISLQKAALDGSEKTTITISRDSAALKSKVKEFQTAYNNVIGFIRQNSQFDAETYQSGPLFGDSTAAMIESQMSSLVFSNVGKGDIKNLAQLGFSLSDQGQLEFSDSQFDKVTNQNPTAVASIFSASGTSASASLRFVGASTAAKAGDYSVDITQAATKSLGVAGVKQEAVSGGGETLTFSGSLFGSTSLVVTTTGGTSTDLVNQLNNDTRLKDLLVASLNEDGKLTITSKNFGSATAFSVTSDQAALDSNSGIGTTGMTVTTGLNVEGTINGEAATGSGQFLLGNKGNSRTDGLQVMYTGTTTGLIGTMDFTQGLANTFDAALTNYTDPGAGILSALDKSLQSQIQDLTSRITTLNEALSSKEESLRLKFARMEEAMSKIQSQGSQISSIVNSSRSS